MDGRGEEALPYLEEALAAPAHTRLLEQRDPKAIKAGKLWTAEKIYAIQVAGRRNEAEKLWRDLIQESERDLGPDQSVTLNYQFDLARLMLEQKNWQEAVPLLQRVVAFRQQTLGENHYFTLDARYCLGAALEQKGDIEAAARSYSAVYPELAKYFTLDTVRGLSKGMADFFVRHGRYQDARGVFEGFRSWFEANPPGNTADFETFVQAAAASKGWPAAAEVCRKNFDRFTDSLWIWLNKAWIFRYASDDESYQRVVAKVLAAAPNLVTTNDQHLPIEIAALGSFPFSEEQVKQLDEMISALAVVLPERSTDLQAYGYRAIGQMQLRLGRLDLCLAALEKSAKQQTSPDSYNLFIRAICLHQLGRRDEARMAFDQGEAIMKPLLTEPFRQSEPFLQIWEIYQQVLMHRETQKLLVVK
jgi:tetratricopeptide (TPR) repeat protein